MNEIPRLTVPGSKSLTNRAVLLAALAKGHSTIHNILVSDDTAVMMEALQKLGVSITQKNHTLHIESTGQWKQPTEALYLGNAGTAVRFLTAMLSHFPFEAKIEGDTRMHERPLTDLLNALKQLGADIESENGCPPLTLHGHPLTQSQTSIVGKNSSQYISALLMLGPLLPNGLELEVTGEITSKPYIDMTLDIMNNFFVQRIEREGYSKFHIPPQSYRATELTIEADASSATYFFALAAITGKTIRIENIAASTLQPDLQILNHLEAMGCTLKKAPTSIEITGPKTLKPLGTVDANAFPDGAMTLAIIAARARGTTTLTGLHNLRIKECDRLTALKTELEKIGIRAETTDDTLTIHGDPQTLNAATIETYNDHRMAMCFGILSVIQSKLAIQNPDCVRKTYPRFWEDLAAIQSQLSP